MSSEVVLRYVIEVVLPEREDYDVDEDYDSDVEEFIDDLKDEVRTLETFAGPFSHFEVCVHEGEHTLPDFI